MSSGLSIPWAEAYALAELAAAALRPHVVRLKAVGSLRRRRPSVGDIELIAEPFMVPADLFGTLTADVAPIRKELEELGTWMKGGERMMRITDLLGRKGLELELHVVWAPAQWGSKLAICTGPADLGHLCMNLLRERGYGHQHGHAVRLKTGETVDTPDEETFFALAGVACLKPIYRDEQFIELARQRYQHIDARRAARR